MILVELVPTRLLFSVVTADRIGASISMTLKSTNQQCQSIKANSRH